MSTLKEIGESKVTISLKPKESIFQSFVRDFITFSMLAFCIYLSQGSTWWTFVTGIMFLLMMSAKLTNLIKDNATTFENTELAIKYLNDLELKD